MINTDFLQELLIKPTPEDLNTYKRMGLDEYTSPTGARYPLAQDYFSPPKTSRINRDFVDSLAADEHKDVQENKSKLPPMADPDKPLTHFADPVPPAGIPDIADPQDLTLAGIKPPVREDAVRALKQIPKGLARGIETGIGTVGSMARWVAERATIGNILTRHTDLPYGAGVVAEYLVRKFGPKKPMEFFDKQMTKYAKQGEKWADFWEEQSQKGWEAPDPEVTQAKWRDMPITKAAATISEAAPNYLVAIASSVLTKSPQTGLLFISALSGAGAYRRQRKAGAGVTKANAIAALTGAWEYVTEKVPFDEVFKPAKSKFLKMLKLGTLEATQEFVQGIGENFLEYFGYKAKDLKSVPAAVKEGLEHTMDGWVENVVAGAGLGVMGAGIVPKGGLYDSKEKEGPAEIGPSGILQEQVIPPTEAIPTPSVAPTAITAKEGVELAPEAEIQGAPAEVLVNDLLNELYKEAGGKLERENFIDKLRREDQEQKTGLAKKETFDDIMAHYGGMLDRALSLQEKLKSPKSKEDYEKTRVAYEATVEYLNQPNPRLLQILEKDPHVIGKEIKHTLEWIEATEGLVEGWKNRGNLEKSQQAKERLKWLRNHLKMLITIEKLYQRIPTETAATTAKLAPEPTPTAITTAKPPITPEKPLGALTLIEEARKYKSAVDYQKLNSLSGHPLDHIAKNTPTINVSSSIFEKEKTAFAKVSESKIAYHERREDGIAYWDKQIKNGSRPPILVGFKDGQIRVVDGNNRLNAYLENDVSNIPIILTKEAQEALSQPPTVAKAEPAKVEKPKVTEEEVTDEELSGITKRERRRLTKETKAKIEESDIYQVEIAGMETMAREVGPGYYYINKGYRGEVEAIIGKRKGPGTKIQRMFTFNPNEKRIITLQSGEKAEIGPTPWESAVQEGLGRGKEGVDQTWGEMDISDFVQRVVDSYQAQETIGGISKQALELAEQSGQPDMQMLAEKHRMLAEGFSDRQINEMITDWAEEYGIDIADIEGEFINEYGTKLRQIKKMEGEEQDAALEQLAREQIEVEDRQAAQEAAREVLEANDIKAEIEQVEEIKPEDFQRDLLGRPVFTPVTVGRTKQLGLKPGEVAEKDVAINYELSQAVARLVNKNITDPKEIAATLMEKPNWKALFKNPKNVMPEVRTALREAIEGRGLPFEMRGRPVGAAISQGQKEVILLAFGADSETGYHEGYHLLRRRLNESDRKVLNSDFKGDEEAEARSFAEFVKTGKTTSRLRAIWNKLLNLLRKIKSGLQGREFRTAEDIFGAIKKGKIEKIPAKAGIAYETRSEKLRREAEKNARIKARKARLVAQAGIKAKGKVKAPRFKINIRDTTPLLGKEYQEGAPRFRRKEAPLKIPIKDVTPALSPELYVDTTLDEIVATPTDIKQHVKINLTDKWFEENRKDYKTTIQDILDKPKSMAADMFKTLDRGFGAISTRLYNLHPGLFRAIRRYAFNSMTRSTDQVAEMEPFLRAMKKMNKEDRTDLDLALKNSIGPKINQIVNKYGLQEEYAVARDLLDDIYNAARLVGIDLEYRRDYWHRELKDPKGFLRYWQGTEDWSIIEEAIKRRAAKAGRKIEELTDEEKARVINTLLRGFRTQALTLSRPGAAKERVIDVVDQDLNRFYHDSSEAIVKYIRLMNAKIAEREFFGKETNEITDLRKLQSQRLTRLMKLQRRRGLKEGTTEGKYKEHISKTKENYEAGRERLKRLQTRSPEESIGGYVMDLQRQGYIEPHQEKELQNLLIAVFNPKGMSKGFGLASTLIYIDTIGSPIQALTQLDEYSYSVYRSPPKSVPALIRAVARKSRIRPRDIGITSIGQEFREPSLKKALTMLLKVTGFQEIDRLNKEIYINTALSKMRAQARKNRPELLRRLSRVFGKDYKQVLNELRKPIKSLDDITDNVKYLLFNELLDIQPVAITEMPEAYNRAGRGRILYTLKTFYIKRLDYIRNECFKDMKHLKTFPRGFAKLVWLSVAFALLGAGSDDLKDFIKGRVFDLKDSIVDNLLRMFMSSKYQVTQMQREGAGRSVLEQFVPPTKSIDAISRDVMTIAKGKDRKFELWRSVPLGGELYYWWFGEGRRKVEATTDYKIKNMTDEELRQYRKDNVYKKTYKGKVKGKYVVQIKDQPHKGSEKLVEKINKELEKRK